MEQKRYQQQYKAFVQQAEQRLNELCDVYLTDRGAFTVNYYRRLLDATLAAMPEYPFPVSADERRNAALALIAALPDRDYREHFGALFAETEVEENEPQPESE